MKRERAAVLYCARTRAHDEVFIDITTRWHMTDYRWNVSETAADYDRLAPVIHPYYIELQDELLGRLPQGTDDEFLVIDAGGGSGRLIERLLERFACANAILVDQSEAFLAVAEKRLERFGGRVDFMVGRLQDNWLAALPRRPDVILSMSAIHHLDPEEKGRFYKSCHDALAPGGVLMNGDEVRQESDAEYRAHLEAWAARMQEVAESRNLSEPMRRTLAGWKRRNVDQFDLPKSSGDDCHEKVEIQLDYLRDAGFAEVSGPW